MLDWLSHLPSHTDVMLPLSCQSSIHAWSAPGLHPFVSESSLHQCTVPSTVISLLRPFYRHGSLSILFLSLLTLTVACFLLRLLIFVKACLILIWGTTHRPNVGKQAFRRSVSASVSRQGAPCTRCSFMAFLFSFWCYLLISFYVCFCLFVCFIVFHSAVCTAMWAKKWIE